MPSPCNWFCSHSPDANYKRKKRLCTEIELSAIPPEDASPGTLASRGLTVIDTIVETVHHNFNIWQLSQLLHLIEKSYLPRG